MNRRDFIVQSAAAGGALVLGGAQVAASNPEKTSCCGLRVLVLGGTGFIGPHFVRAALERGHNVSVFLFNRGKGSADLPAGIEPLWGDRNGDLEALKNRDWDAVFDLATYGPAWVRSLGQALKDRVRHYTFISTVSVYQFPGAIDETSPVLEYTDTVDPYSITTAGSQYGALKVLCERQAEKQFPDRTLILRPSAIVGPRDRLGAFTYRPVRFERGGEILVTGDPLAPVQLIDVRDLAEWTVRLAEKAQTGVFNSVGPAMAMGWGEMLGALRGMFSIPMKLTWVPTAWLIERKVPAWSSLLFWPSEANQPGVMRVANDKARAEGLTFRSLNTTAADTLAWYRTQPAERQGSLLMGVGGRGTAVEDAMAREQELLAAWHAGGK